jgi:hypothetical protein
MLAIVGVVGYGLQTEPARDVKASVTLTETAPPPDRTVSATVRLDPPTAADDAGWFNVTSWQGGEPFVLDELEQVGPGTYRTSEPIPVSGSWKTMLRLHRDDSIVSAPIFLAADPGIPVGEVSAPASFERPFVADKEVLQREQKEDVPTALPPVAYGVVGAIAAALVLIMGWALARLGASVTGETPPPRERRGRAPRAATEGGAA